MKLCTVIAAEGKTQGCDGGHDKLRGLPPQMSHQDQKWQSLLLI